MNKSDYLVLLNDSLKLFSFRKIVRLLLIPTLITVGLFVVSYVSVPCRKILISSEQVDKIIADMMMFTSILFPFTVALFTVFASGGDNIKELKKIKTTEMKNMNLYQKLLNLLTINMFLTIFVTIQWLILRFSLIKDVTPNILIWLFINILLTFTLLIACLNNALNIYFVLWKDK